jgi:hypothetical protein
MPPCTAPPWWSERSVGWAARGSSTSGAARIPRCACCPTTSQPPGRSDIFRLLELAESRALRPGGASAVTEEDLRRGVELVYLQRMRTPADRAALMACYHAVFGDAGPPARASLRPWPEADAHEGRGARAVAPVFAISDETIQVGREVLTRCRKRPSNNSEAGERAPRTRSPHARTQPEAAALRRGAAGAAVAAERAGAPGGVRANAVAGGARGRAGDWQDLPGARPRPRPRKGRGWADARAADRCGCWLEWWARRCTRWCSPPPPTPPSCWAASSRHGRTARAVPTHAPAQVDLQRHRARLLARATRTASQLAAAELASEPRSAAASAVESAGSILSQLHDVRQRMQASEWWRAERGSKRSSLPHASAAGKAASSSAAVAGSAARENELLGAFYQSLVALVAELDQQLRRLQAAADAKAAPTLAAIAVGEGAPAALLADIRTLQVRAAPPWPLVGRASRPLC